MARARNIKPSFFTNEQVSDNCPLGRLLFIGLWTMADYKGDLEWKEKTLKIQILPWDECSVKQLAINLDKSGLVRFYSDGNKIYLNIPNFEKHQNPHKNERDKGSDIPHYSDSMRQVIDLQGLTINRDLSGLKPEYSHSDRADSLLLIPDSSILNPDCVIPESPQAAPPATPEKKSRKHKSELDYSAWGESIDQQLLTDWLTVRRTKRAAVTQTVLDAAGSEFRKAASFGYTVNDCLRCWVAAGWQGFKFEWMQNQLTKTGVNTNAGQPKSPIERFMQQHYPDAGSGFENDQRPMGGNDGFVRGAMDSELRGNSGQVGTVAPDLIGDFSRTDS